MTRTARPNLARTADLLLEAVEQTIKPPAGTPDVLRDDVTRLARAIRRGHPGLTREDVESSIEFCARRIRSSGGTRRGYGLALAALGAYTHGR